VDTLGDPLPLPSLLEDSSPSELGRLFGESFAEGLATVEANLWQGPVESGFGWHLVYVYDREPGRQPALDEVRPAVEREVLSQRRAESIDRLYETLAENYTIDIEPLVMEPEEGAVGQ
jgi:hypothetical protein